MATKCYAHHGSILTFVFFNLIALPVLIGMQVMGRALDKSTRAEFNGRTYPRMEKSAPNS